MIPILDSALRDFGLDPNQLNGSYNGATSWNTQSGPKTDTLGNIFGSIRNGVSAGAGFIGNLAKQTFYDQPAALFNYEKQQLRPLLHDPFDPNSQYRKSLSQINYDQQVASKLGQPNNQLYNQQRQQLTAQQLKEGVSKAAHFANLSNVITDPEYRKVALPVYLTAASALAPEIKPIQAAAEGSTALDVAKALPGKAFNSLFAPGKTLVEGKGPISSLANVASKTMIRQPLVVNPTINAATSIPGQLQQGNYAGAAGNTAMLATPAILSATGKAFKVAGNAIDNAIFSRPGSVINQLIFKNGETLDSFLANLPKTQQQKYLNIAKVAENHYQGEGTTAQKLIKSLALDTQPINKMSAQDFLDRQQVLAQSSNKVVNTVKKLKEAAINGDQVAKDKLTSVFAHYPTGKFMSRVGVGRFSQGDAAKFIKDLKATNGDPVLVNNTLNRALGTEQWAKNPAVSARIQSAVQKNNTGNLDNMIKKLNGIVRTRNIGDKLGLKLPNGYFPILKPEGSAGFVKASRAEDLIPNYKAPLEKVGNVINKLGLSPKAVNPMTVKDQLETNLGKQLEGTKFAGLEQNVMDIMSKMVGQTKTAIDPRQLSLSKFKNAIMNESTLKSIINEPKRADAAQLKRAFLNAYSKLPANLVGAGNKSVNVFSKYIPAEQYYLRTKGALSYQFNPFFQARVITKSSLISLAEGSNPLTKINSGTMDALRANNYLNKANTDANLNDLYGNIPNVGGDRQVNGAMQKILGTLAESIAKAHNTTVPAILENKSTALYKQLDHALTVTTGYPKGSYFDSPLAKTLNVLVFPSRFDTKVLTVAGKYFAKQSPAVQIGLVKSIASGEQWLKSPDGEKWKKDNAAALNVVNYMVPTESVSQVLNFVKTGKLADLGQVGGMPFGVITQMLRSSGVNLPSALEQSAQINDATGLPYNYKVGNTNKAKLQLALQDLIGSMFSYPGAKLGLLSKTNLMQDIVPALKPDKGSVDYVSTDKAPSLGSISSTGTKTVLNSANQKFRPGAISRTEPKPIQPIYKIKKSKIPARPISSLI